MFILAYPLLGRRNIKMMANKAIQSTMYKYPNPFKLHNHNELPAVVEIIIIVK